MKSKTRFISLFLLFFCFIFFGQKIFLKLKTRLLLNKYQKNSSLQAQKNKDEYKKLLDKPISATEINSNYHKKNQRQALNDHNLYFVFAKSSSLADYQINPLINSLKTGITYNLDFVNAFFTKEAKKYNIDNFNLHIKTTPIYSLSDLDKAGDFNYIWEKNPFSVNNIEDKFESLVIKNNLQVGKNDLVIFLYFDNSFVKNPGPDTYSFYEYKKFRSFANEEKGRAYVNIYDFSPSFVPQLIEIAIHETTHLFGATDKYIESSKTGACSKKGRGEMDKQPIFPQTKADIMCLFVEKEEGSFYRARITDNNLVINKATAKEIGWIKD